MNRVAKIGLGCLLLPVGLTVLSVLFFLTMKAAGVPDPAPKEQEFAQEIGTRLEGLAPGTTMQRADDASALSASAAAAAVIVDIDVEECAFYLESGPIAHPVAAPQGLVVPVIKDITNKNLRQIAEEGNFSDADIAMNEITVFLPEETPIVLRAKMAKGEGEMLLDDLVLTEFVTEGRMGEYSFSMDTPNPVTMESSSITLAMGEGTFRGLSNLRARELEVQGSMGEIRLDFGNSLLVDTAVLARMKMGEMSIEVPDDALYDPESRVKATMGEVNNGMKRGQRVADPELARRISLDAAVLMGELRLEPFRVRPGSRMYGQ